MNFDITLLPETQNGILAQKYADRPKRLNLQEFQSLEITEEERVLRDKIYAFEDWLFTIPQAYVDKDIPYQPIHTIVPGSGVYIRTLAIPPHQVVVGRRHSIEHQVLLTKGSCLCVTERGLEKMVAPCQFISPAGKKRIVYTTDEEAVWVTIHRTDKTTIEEIEADIRIDEPERMFAQLESRRLLK